MANVPRSSFIPKQVTQSAIPKKVRHTRVFSIFGFLSGLLLFVSLAGSIGIFVYKQIEERKLATQKEVLAAERGKFNEDDIAEVRAFNERIELARALLDAHVSPSKVFIALENTTKQSVQYTTFSFVRRPSGDVSLDLTGVTDDFAKVALQSLENSEDFILKDMAVTEIAIGTGSEGEGAPQSKVVSFNLVSNVPASKLLFEAEGFSGTEPEADAASTVDDSSGTTTGETVEQEETMPAPSTQQVGTTTTSTSGTAQ
jgi:hypothetical protein